MGGKVLALYDYLLITINFYRNTVMLHKESRLEKEYVK